ncbi:hypothetical protein KQ693_05705 [Thermus sp. PS18]|uniref:hypothetical protein n=1 Tax=Thermus sp. PS18 TaxID=2849039 RepID=UPI002264D14D|nr:hypothetical protein [Thermus sp. PS18]UZX16525.1 hypothetical protein KQ693_05705 [Thermus sp. PS18]
MYRVVVDHPKVRDVWELADKRSAVRRFEGEVAFWKGVGWAETSDVEALRDAEVGYPDAVRLEVLEFGGVGCMVIALEEKGGN